MFFYEEEPVWASSLTADPLLSIKKVVPGIFCEKQMNCDKR